jgi:hypothetical protein
MAELQTSTPPEVRSGIKPADEVLQRAFHRVAELIEVGMPPRDIAVLLEKEGVPSDTVAEVIRSCTPICTLGTCAGDSMRGLRKDLVHGIWWGGGGVVVTVMNYFLSGHASIYLPSCVAVVYGAVRLMRALRKSLL